MTRNSLDERAKKLYRYFVTKEGEMPDMKDEENKKAVQYLFNNHYLIRKEYASPQTTPEGERWAREE